MNKRKILKQRGVILIEAILALGIVVVIVTGIVTALVSSLNSSGYSKNETLATGYSQEGLEIVRNLRDIDYSVFSGLVTGTYCLPKDAVLNSSSSPGICSTNIDSTFKRTIYINTNGNDPRSGTTLPKCEVPKTAGTPPSVFIASSVSWTDGKCTSSDCHKVELNACLTNLNSVPGL